MSKSYHSPSEAEKSGRPRPSVATPEVIAADLRSSITGSADHAVPMVIGVTGHRDLVPAEVPKIAALVRRFFTELQSQFPDMDLAIMSSLAEGADRLVAREALAMGFPLLVAMPMPPELYVQDFESSSSRAEFERLRAQGEVLQLPIAEGESFESVSEHGPARDRQYAQAGVYLAAHCHVLLALWDGKMSGKLGGTAQVVQFHHDDIMPGFTEAGRRSQQILADDESDLVYHIVCSRDGPDGQPEPSLRPLQTGWYTTDDEHPRTETIPERYVRIFERTSEFNRDAERYSEHIAAGKYDLLSPENREFLPPATAKINELFTIADWLAIKFQKQVNFVLRATYSLAVLMGLAFIAYSDLANLDFMIYAFLFLFALGVALYIVANKGEWHRSYLDYRALAEGLRIQFYWTAAGVRSGYQTKFAHDNFLQKQDVELGWIRNVMRVAVLRSDVETSGDIDTGLDFAIREWIGDETGGGQSGYFEIKARRRERRVRMTGMLGLACLGSGILVAIVLAVFGSHFDESVRNPLIIAMGILPLIAAVREAYSHKKAEKELIKQYRFMHRIFSNAKRKLSNAESAEQKRDILHAVGNAALDEHAEWILIHRERPLEHSKL